MLLTCYLTLHPPKLRQVALHFVQFPVSHRFFPPSTVKCNQKHDRTTLVVVVATPEVTTSDKLAWT